MHVVVLGAGVIGVTTAYYLAKEGHKVTVIDRRREAAAECSYANGGQLSYTHIEPWANPHIFGRLPSWLIQWNSPLSASFPFKWDMMIWVSKFLRNCRQDQCESTSKAIWELAQYSKTCLESLLKEESLSFDYSQNGTLHLFCQQHYLESNLRLAETQATFGLDFQLIQGKEACVELEPVLAHSKRPLVGGLYYPTDATGNVHVFTQQLAQLCKKQGVEFRFNTYINDLDYENNVITAVNTDQGRIEGDAFVMALGAYSNELLKPLELRIWSYPIKGYSLTIPIEPGDTAPKMNITDQANKIVYSSLGTTLRAAGMGDFVGYNHDVKPKRIKTLKHSVSQLFPYYSGIEQAEEWSCLRPSTADCLPVLGKSDFKNLYLNTGHGSLGWTLSVGSAKAVSDIICEKPIAVAIDSMSPERIN